MQELAIQVKTILDSGYNIPYFLTGNTNGHDAAQGFYFLHCMKSDSPVRTFLMSLYQTGLKADNSVHFLHLEITHPYS
jgi:hypothetical protein